ncbi:MAG: MFS transporter [Pseudomonadales bacterium]
MADRHYRWVVVLYSLVIQAVSIGILIYCFALFVLPWLDDFSASRRDVMITISLFQVGMGVLSPLIGRLFDIYPIRFIVVAGAGLLSTGLWLTHLATALWQVWLIYATIMPLSCALMGTLASQTLVAKWFHDKRGLALGLSAMGTSIGGVVFPLVVAGWLVDIGWRETFTHLALTCLLLVIPLTLIVLRRQPPARPAPQSSGQDMGDYRIWTSREILTTSLFWLPFLSLVPLNMAFGALQFNLAVFARDSGLDDATAAQLISISSFCMIVGKLFFGSLGDRLDHRYLYWIAAGCMALSILLFLTAASYAGLLIAVVCMGLAGGGVLPLMGLIFGARFGAASFGRVMGFVMLNVLFGATAPVLAGWIYDVSGSYVPALWGLLLLIAPALIAMVRLPKPQLQQPVST